jgi:hypothetical protein
VYDSSSVPRGRHNPIATATLAALAAAALAVTAPARAVEVLSVHELVSHCERLEANPDGVDGQYCLRYIQGFIDGAVATDVRVLINAEAHKDKEESFMDRVTRTRIPSRADQIRAAQMAGFCLGDPLPLREVVDVVVADLVALDVDGSADSPAREAVYASLQNHFPCPE